MQRLDSLRFLHLLFAALLITACAHPVAQWGKAGATPEQTRQDQAECKYQVDLAGSGHHTESALQKP